MICLMLYRGIGKFIFLHIPRTGGRSFKYICQKSGLFVKDLNFDQPEVSYDFDVLMGHFRLEYAEKFGLPIFTIVRHPVDRLISQFFYFQQKPYLFDQTNTEKTDDILEFSYRFRNLMVHMIQKPSHIDHYFLMDDLSKYHSKTNISKKKEITEKDVQNIEKMNTLDLLFYNWVKDNYK